jgi:hypothetical protein
MKMIPMPLVLVVLVVLPRASPAVGQPLADLARVEAARRQVIGRAEKIYTNADLKPARLVRAVRPVVRPSDIYERFLARRAALQARAPFGPTVVVFGSPTAGPFGEFAPFPEPRRLDGTLLSDPPWSVTTYVGRYGRPSLFLPQGAHQHAAPAGSTNPGATNRRAGR